MNTRGKYHLHVCDIFKDILEKIFFSCKTKAKITNLEETFNFEQMEKKNESIAH